MAVGRFSAEFVEGRRRALERFLNRTAAHPDLARSAHFDVFLRADDAATRMRSDKPGGKKNGGIMKWMGNAASAVTTSFGASGSSPPKTEADRVFEEVSAYIAALEPQMQALFKHTQTLVRRGRDVAQAKFEFGLAFSLLSQSESGRLRQGLGQMGKASDALSVLAQEYADEEALAFEEPIHDYMRIVGAVKAAIGARNDKKLAHHTACMELRSRQAAHDKAKMSGSSKAAQLRKEVELAQKKVAQSQEEFEVVSARVMREVEKFKTSKRADFKTIVCDFVQLQIEHAQKVQKEWEQLIPEMESLQAQGDGGGTDVEVAAGASTAADNT